MYYKRKNQGQPTPEEILRIDALIIGYKLGAKIPLASLRTVKSQYGHLTHDELYDKFVRDYGKAKVEKYGSSYSELKFRACGC